MPTLIGVTKVQIFSSLNLRPSSRPLPPFWHCGCGWTAISFRNSLKILAFSTLPMIGGHVLHSAPSGTSQRIRPKTGANGMFSPNIVDVSVLRVDEIRRTACFCIASLRLLAESRGVAPFIARLDPLSRLNRPDSRVSLNRWCLTVAWWCFYFLL